MKTRLYLGTRLPALVDQLGPQQSWPDKDLRAPGGVRTEGSGILVGVAQGRFPRGVRALALAYDTDWDLVRVVVGDAPAEVLGPGQVLRIADQDARIDVQPHVNIPSTRLYDASRFQKQQKQAPTKSIGAIWQIAHGLGVGAQITNISAVTQTVYRWDGGAFGSSFPVIAGATIMDGASNWVVTDAHDGVNTPRPADYSPDGNFNFADYMEANLISSDDGSPTNGIAYQSNDAIDSQGNPGSTGNATTVHYIGGSNAGISTAFYGRLSLDLFDECPPHGYVPRLAPSRFVTLGQLAVPHIGAVPDTAILTVPALNIERAQFTFRNAAGGHDVYAQLVQPRAEDWIDQTQGIADADPSSGLTFATVATGASGALFLDEPASPFIKLNLGAAAGGATIAAGAVLELVRRVCQ